MLTASRAHRPRGIWDLLIGADEPGCLEYLRRLVTAEPPSLCHYSAFLIAEIDGEPGAALSRFEAQAGGWALVGQAIKKVQRDLAWTGSDVAASRQRIAPVWACFLPEIDADWGIENVATRPECRRLGLANALLKHTLEEMSQRGGKLAQIITMVGNDPAVFVYHKCGFRVLDERQCGEMQAALGAPGFIRLVRDLGFRSGI